LREVLDLISRFLVTLHVILVALGLFSAELPLEDIGERVWHLCLACEDTAH